MYVVLVALDDFFTANIKRATSNMCFENKPANESHIRLNFH